jgi:uncharacterized RDD family membrane protein YckC
MTKAQTTSRIAAVILDGFLISFGVEAIHSVFHIHTIQIGHAALSGPAAIGMLLTVVYFAAMEASPQGATVGKQVMRIRVTTLDGQRLSRRQSVARAVTRLIPLGWLLVLSENQRALHDYFAGSQVVEV